MTEKIRRNEQERILSVEMRSIHQTLYIFFDNMGSQDCVSDREIVENDALGG